MHQSVYGLTVRQPPVKRDFGSVTYDTAMSLSVLMFTEKCTGGGHLISSSLEILVYFLASLATV